MLYYKILIDTRKCDGCGKCVEACPARILTVGCGKAVVTGDLDECMGCEFCVEACPLNCIAVRPRVVQPEESMT